MVSKPFSQACVNNRDAIYQKLKLLLSRSRSVLEVGSGTGQHAVYFSKKLPHLSWQTSDLTVNHCGIRQWIREEGESNCLPPIELDVAQTTWSLDPTGAIFTANTFHIMSKKMVEQFFMHAGKLLVTGGWCIVYGPFNYQGQYTSNSNAQFDQWLQSVDPSRGIREIEWINDLATDQGLRWYEDYEMPANNRLQVWQKD